MARDIGWKTFFNVDERFADIVNGFGCEGEYLYGFRKDSRMWPVASFILYSGEEEWSGPTTLHELLDFTRIPQSLRKMVADYKINLIDIRRLKDTSMLKTDVKQVFDFIRCANDKKSLRKLIESDEYYEHMEEDAFDVAVQYTNAKELIKAKEYYREERGIAMCRALTELIEDGREEGREEGEILKLVKLIKKKLEKNQSIEQIAEALEESAETIQSLIKEYIEN